MSLAQREAFREEYAALSLGKPIPQKSQLIKLNPCIDEDGVIRCDGRLRFAEILPYDTRCHNHFASRRSASGTMNVMNTRKDGTSKRVRLWRHSLRQGYILLAGPSPKQPRILHVLRIPFKDPENLVRKGGCACLLVWKHEQCN